MKQTVKVCNKSNLESALKELSNAKLIVMTTQADGFEQCVKKMGELVPDVPNIGVCGQGYYELKDCPNDIILVGFYDCEAIADIFNDINKPILSVHRLMKYVEEIRGNANNTVCLDFSTGNDSVVITTFNTCLDDRGIPLIGGTSWDTRVSYNGVVYENACVYALIKNNSGTIKAYMENIYTIDESMPDFIATKIDEKNPKIITLNNQSAAKVYQETLNIKESDIENQTFKNPIGRIVGDKIYIISVKNKCPDGSLETYKRANSMDALTILKLGDYDSIIKDTVSNIKKDIPSIKGIFSINCLFRYFMFNDFHYTGDYLKTMNQLNNHVGFVACGEHYRTQHVNQTMTCFVFD